MPSQLALPLHRSISCPLNSPPLHCSPQISMQQSGAVYTSDLAQYGITSTGAWLPSGFTFSCQIAPLTLHYNGKRKGIFEK